MDKGFTSFKGGYKSLLNKPFLLIFSFICCLTVFVIFTAKAEMYTCSPCLEDHYCPAGVLTACPNETFTAGTGASSLSECKTCEQLDSNYPYYDIASGECKACWQIDENYPVWSGSACVACASGTTWQDGICKSDVPMSCDENDVCVLTEDIPNTVCCKAGARVINSVEKFEYLLSATTGGNFCITNDIDFATYEGEWNSLVGYDGVCLDGNNKKIKNIPAPLFETTYQTKLSNIILEDVNFTCSYTCSALVRTAHYAYPDSSCSLTGTIPDNVVLYQKSYGGGGHVGGSD